MIAVKEGVEERWGYRAGGVAVDADLSEPHGERSGVFVEKRAGNALETKAE